MRPLRTYGRNLLDHGRILDAGDDPEGAVAGSAALAIDAVYFFDLRPERPVGLPGKPLGR